MRPSLRIALLISLLFSTQVTADMRWLDRREEGWFWYKEEPELVEPTPIEETPAPPPLSPPPPTEQKVEDRGPQVLSAAWVKANMQNYLEAAIDNPSPDNIAAFLYLQKYAMDVSFRFMDGVNDISRTIPELNPNTHRPTQEGVATAIDATKKEIAHNLFQRVANNSSLFFFFNRDLISEKMAASIEMLTKFAYINVLPIDVSGMGGPFVQFQETKIDAGHANTLGVYAFPAVVLMGNDKNATVVTQAYQAPFSLYSDIIRSSVKIGIVSIDEANSIRGTENIDKMYASEDVIPLTSKMPAGYKPSAQELIQIFRGSQY